MTIDTISLFDDLRTITEPPTAREALGKIIWDASRRDEGSISYTGANIVADAILDAGYVKAEPKALPSFVDGHVLVAFHRDKTEDEREEIFESLSDAEAELQDQLDEFETSSGDDGYPSHDVVVVGDRAKAQGITSWDRTVSTDNGKTWHRVMLDIDMPAALVPSTTPGHSHLYIDKLLTWEDYSDLLELLGSLGIIEEGYANASIDRGYSSLRLPWIAKPAKVKSATMAFA